VEDSTSHGTPALKVRGKLFVRLHQDGECFVLLKYLEAALEILGVARQ
jgi:hypothetical protein